MVIEAARCRPPTTAEHVVIGLDGGYVRHQPSGSERTFEVIAGQIREVGAPPTRFTFVRKGSLAGAARITQALREHGVNQHARVTVLSDGNPVNGGASPIRDDVSVPLVHGRPSPDGRHRPRSSALPAAPAVACTGMPKHGCLSR